MDQEVQILQQYPLVVMENVKIHLWVQSVDPYPLEWVMMEALLCLLQMIHQVKTVRRKADKLLS